MWHLVKKSYKTHQLKHTGILQLTEHGIVALQPIKNFKTRKQNGVFNCTVIMQSNDSQFHGNNLKLHQEEAATAPSPLGRPEVDQLKA